MNAIQTVDYWRQQNEPLMNNASTELLPRTVTVAFSTGNELLRLGFERILQQVGSVQGYTIRESAAELTVITDPVPDIVIVPIKELDESPAAFISRLPGESKVLLLLDQVADECVPYIAAASAHGYLSKLDLSAQTLSDALRAVACGEVPMPSDLPESCSTGRVPRRRIDQKVCRRTSPLGSGRYSRCSWTG